MGLPEKIMTICKKKDQETNEVAIVTITITQNLSNKLGATKCALGCRTI